MLIPNGSFILRM